MDLDELQFHMETLMRVAYEIAGTPIEEVLDRLAQPMVLRHSDPIFLGQKNDMMVKIFKQCLTVKELMIEIQPEVQRIKQFEEMEKKGGGHRA